MNKPKPAFTDQELRFAIVANACQLDGNTTFAAAIVELLRKRTP